MILSAADEPYRTFYVLLAETDMRLGELCGGSFFSAFRTGVLLSIYSTASFGLGAQESGRKRFSSNYASRVNLEAKPRLQLDDAAAEGVGPLSERAVGRGHGLRGRCAAARRRDIDGADLLRAERSEVELIEQIVEIGAKFDFGVLAQNGNVRQSKSLAECCVNRRIAGPAEEIARNTRRWRNAYSGAQVWRSEVGGRRVGKVDRTRFKPRVAGVGACAAEIRGWPNSAKITICVDQATWIPAGYTLYLYEIERSPREAAVSAKNS